MRKKNIKSIAKVTVDGVGAVVEAAAVAVNPAGGVIVVIIQSIVDEVIDNHKERNNGQVFKLNKAILEKKKSEIFGIDDIPEEQIDLYFDQICKELGNWRFDVTENIRHYHYLDKCAQDIAERINPSEERLVLYTRRTPNSRPFMTRRISGTLRAGMLLILNGNC